MKKSIGLMAVILLIIMSVCVFAQGSQQTERGNRQGRERGNRPQMQMNMMMFGISAADFAKLGLTQEQTDKLKEYQKLYQEKVMVRRPQQNGSGKNAPQQMTREDIEKMAENQRNAEKQLMADFKSLLTKEQSETYNRLYSEQIDKTKKSYSAELESIKTKLGLTEEQNGKIKQIIDAYDGDQYKFRTDFMNILTKEQQTEYMNIQRENMKKMMPNLQNGDRKGFNRQKGRDRRGQKKQETAE